LKKTFSRQLNYVSSVTLPNTITDLWENTRNQEFSSKSSKSRFVILIKPFSILSSARENNGLVIYVVLSNEDI